MQDQFTVKQSLNMPVRFSSYLKFTFYDVNTRYGNKHRLWSHKSWSDIYHQICLSSRMGKHYPLGHNSISFLILPVVLIYWSWEYSNVHVCNLISVLVLTSHMWLDLQKLSLMVHLVFRGILYWNIETTVFPLCYTVATPDLLYV